LEDLFLLKMVDFRQPRSGSVSTSTWPLEGLFVTLVFPGPLSCLQ
jgi:hypothetical protein